MIETYLDNLTKLQESEKSVTITPLVENLSGVIELTSDFDHKKDYGNYIVEMLSR